jgi:hypothetical protein
MVVTLRLCGFLLSLLALLIVESGHSASANSIRVVYQEGVVHFTNAPASPGPLMPEGPATESPRVEMPEPKAGRYAAEIREAAERYGVEPRLVEAMISVESAFNPRAVSRKGARGLMQLMPQTAASLGVRNSFDPRENVRGGVRYLRNLLDRYGGNIPLALAAYNAGPQVVEGYGGIPPYPETVQYVQRILGLYQNGDVVSETTAETHDAKEAPQVVYRYEDEAGRVMYTNIPPVIPGSSR